MQPHCIHGWGAGLRMRRMGGESSGRVSKKRCSMHGEYSTVMLDTVMLDTVMLDTVMLDTSNRSLLQYIDYMFIK